MSLTDLDPTGASKSAGNSIASSNFNPLNMVASGRAYLDTLANRYILKPTNAKGIAGFVFDYEGETTITIQSDITDHYSEQNAYFQDQAAQKPQRIVLKGFVGEIVANPNTGVLGAIATLQGKLTTLDATLGKYTPSIVQKIQGLATQATNVVNKIDNAISRAQNIVGLFIGSAQASTNQQKAYQQLYALWSNNIVFTLETPFNYFQSVMIEHMLFVQDETTRQWSEIQVTVKEVRFIQSTGDTTGLSSALAKQSNMGRAAASAQSPVNKGVLAGIKTSFQLVSSAFGHEVQTPIGA